MIEHHQDEEVCRRWDVLADEDHTCHLSEQEYFYYKNKWWLHSNKSGSHTLPSRKRSDFKQALSTLERLQQEAGEEPVELARFLVVFLQFRKSKEASQVLSERGDPSLIVFWREPPKMAFKNSIHFVTDRSFTADGGLL